MLGVFLLQWSQSKDNEITVKETNWTGFDLEAPIHFLRFLFQHAFCPKDIRQNKICHNRL